MKKKRRKLKRSVKKRLRIFFLCVICLGAVYLVVNRKQEDVKGDSEETTTEAVVQKKALKKSVQLDVPLVNQMDAPSLYNGCEVASLAMILQYKGINVTKNQLAAALPSVPLTYSNGEHGDPNQGFVGDVTGTNPGYGVYHKPIATLAKKFVGTGLTVKDISGASLQTLKKYLSEGNPIWIETTVTLAATDDVETWQTPNGEVTASWSTHSVAVTGYDGDSFFVNNPYGTKNQEVSLTNFKEAWQQMGSQAIVVVGKTT